LTASLPGRTLCAIELPGIGASTLPTPATLDSIVDILAEAIEAAGLAGAPIVAFDLAAPLALRLPNVGSRAFPGLDAARAWARQGLCPPDLRARDDGTHLTALFAHLRDRHVLDPEGSRCAARVGEPLPDAEALDAMMVTAGAAPTAYAALWAVCLEAVGGLTDHPCPSTEQLASVLGNAVGDEFHGLPAARPRAGIWRDYVDIARGRVHLRRCGLTGRALIALHSAPAGSAPLGHLLEGLGSSRSVIAPDFIGNGDSTRPDHPVDIARLGRDVIELADALDLQEFDLWGTHTGALVALEAAIQAPARVGRVVLEAPPLLSPAFAADLLAHYFPALEPDAWGLYLQQAWNMRRDMFLFWPWYRTDRAAARPLPVPEADFLHDWVIGLLTSGRTYHRSYRAAFEYDTRDRLPHLTVPVMLCAGPADMLADALVTARPLLRADAVIAATPATVWYPAQGEQAIAETIAMYQRFLDGPSIA
jgi:pimeloyl-ACP methyl ester carboxylesterase